MRQHRVDALGVHIHVGAIFHVGLISLFACPFLSLCDVTLSYLFVTHPYFSLTQLTPIFHTTHAYVLHNSISHDSPQSLSYHVFPHGAAEQDQRYLFFKYDTTRDLCIFKKSPNFVGLFCRRDPLELGSKRRHFNAASLVSLRCTFVSGIVSMLK